MSTLGSEAAVPPATRARPPGWRDPRLWVGVAIVAVSVVAGARVLGSADDTARVWAASTDLAAGARNEPDDLVATSVRFADETELDRYLLVDDVLPGDRTLARSLGGGELVPRAALGAVGSTGTLQLSLALPAGQVPPAVAPGASVDVWVVDDDTAARAVDAAGPGAREVLDDVVVISSSGAGDDLAGGGDQQLVLGVPADDADALAEVIAAAREDRVEILGRG